MTKLSRTEPFLFFIGDLAVLVISLWIALVLRYADVPSAALFYGHLAPFSLLFLAWILVFYIAGLYEKKMLILERQLPGTLFRAQLANSAIAAVFFYLFPFYSITPKTNLAIDLAISFFLLLGWRLLGASLISVQSRAGALLIGRGPELAELRDEVNGSSRYSYRFTASIDIDQVPEGALEQRISDIVSGSRPAVIAADFSDRRLSAALPRFYGLLFSGITFVEFGSLYEDIFGRVPLSTISYRWFLENISLSRKPLYDAFKRAMDIALSIPVGLAFLASYPFVWLALRIEDGGPAFSVQKRVGQGSEEMTIYKYRTMDGDYRGGWIEPADRRVTRAGKFLRKSRLDELPQFWNVLRGDISFIGPRPDVIGNYEHLVEELAYYPVRYVAKPGLSGWAQISQKLPPQSLEETQLRLSYDFYYIKNRSLLLDLKIALRTIQTLLSRLGV